jgi:hypothetical protein
MTCHLEHLASGHPGLHEHVDYRPGASGDVPVYSPKPGAYIFTTVTRWAALVIAV